MKAFVLAIFALCLFPPVGAIAQNLDEETLESLKKALRVENYDHVQALQMALKAKDPNSRAEGIASLRSGLMPDAAVRILLEILSLGDIPD